MREHAYAALRRYEAMAGRLEGIPEAAERQAESDRARYGDRYTWRGPDGRVMWNDLMVIRFLVEVCGLPLKESRDTVIENCRTKGVAMPGDMSAPQDKAQELFATFGNILEARELAAFWADMFADDEAAAGYWRAVCDHIETERFAAEDTGLANWG